MTITTTTNTVSTIEYNEEEWVFIETLSEKAQKLIRRGLATVYDFGFKK